MYQLFPTATLEWMPPRKLYTPKKSLDIAFPSLRRKSKKETLVLEPHVGEAVTSLSTQIAPRQPRACSESRRIAPFAFRAEFGVETSQPTTVMIRR